MSLAFVSAGDRDPLRLSARISLIAATAAACMLLAAPHRVARAADDHVIVAFGDSTTAPRGKLRVYADLIAPQLAEHNVAVRVVNAGVGGHNTNHARARFEKDVLAHNPRTVIIQFGINDAAVDVWKNPPAKEPRVAIESFERNLRFLVDTLQQRQINVVLMTPNPLRWTSKMREMYGKPPYRPDDGDGFNVKLKNYAERVREIAKAEDVPLVDVYQQFTAYGAKAGQTVDALLLDGIHPNQRGQQIVADQLTKQLVALTNDGQENPAKRGVDVQSRPR